MQRDIRFAFITALLFSAFITSCTVETDAGHELAVTGSALTGGPAPYTVLLPASADTAVTSVYPFSNFGTATTTPISGGQYLGIQQGVIQFDTAAMSAAVRGRTVTLATLEIPIASVTTAGSLSVHRMTHAWVETQATQQCASDSNVNNALNDCTAANVWYMDPFNILRSWVNTPTATASVAAGQSVLSINVTADVALFATGAAPNYGWTIRAGDALPFGVFALNSRENLNPPRLLLQLVGGPTSPAAVKTCQNAVVFNTTLSKSDAARKFQTDWAMCAGPDVSNCKAAVVGQANVDYALAASQVAQGTLTPAKYLAISRDRTRKVNKADQVPSWSCGVAVADVDHDLVPDALDACPTTPPLTPTFDDGCTDSTVVGGPSAADVQAILATMGAVTAGPNTCKGASGTVEPMVPSITVLFRPVFQNGSYAMYIGAEPIQPADPSCPTWYEIEATVGDGTRRVDLYHFAMRDTTGQLHDAARQQVLFFPSTNDPSAAAFIQRIVAIPSGVGGTMQVRMRVVQGTGYRSAWSPTLAVNL